MRRSRPSRQRGFALMIVLASMLLAASAIVIILDRQGTQNLAVRRELNGYMEHHGSKGIEEALSAWSASLVGLNLQDLVAQDPHIVDLNLPTGHMISLTLSDGQGTLLTNYTSLQNNEPAAAQAMLSILETTLGAGASDYIRDVGPLPVSIHVAPAPVLEAAAAYIMGDGERSVGLASALTRLQAGGGVTSTDLTNLASSEGLSPEQRQRLSMVVTDRPLLWNMRVEMFTPQTATRGPELVSVYVGLMRVNAGQNGRASILSFRPLPPDDVQ